MLVGRDAEIAKVHALLAARGGRARVVTLHGPPGIGKTALATAIAHGAGAVYCDLAGAKTIEDVGFCIAGALDASVGGGADLAAVLASALGERLIVLDAAEAASAAVARLAVSLAANARVLVVSREALRVEEEVAVAVEPLGRADARALFVAVASRARPSFDPSAHEDTLAALDDALSGVPLAIVLAASRLAIVSVDALLVRIRDRIDFLSAKRAGAPERHASLRSAFDSSLSALAPDEIATLSQCAVFRGAFTLEAAEHVVELPTGAPVADALQSLVEKSLVRSREREGLGVRFDMLEIVRRLVMESAGELEGARDRHAAYFAHEGARWDASSWYGGAPELPRLRAIQNDLLAARAHAREPTALLESAIALYPLFAARGPYPAFLALLDEAKDDRACEGVAPSLAARFLLVRGRALQLCTKRDEAAKAFEKSLHYARKSREGDGAVLAARALAWLALARRTQGAMVEARERFEASAALFRQAGDASSEAVVLSGLASLDLGEADLDAAKHALESAIDVLIRSGDAATAAMMRVDLGIVLQESGDLEGARAVYEAAFASHRAAGNKRHEGITLGYLGTLEDEAGRLDAAEVALSRAIAIAREVSDAKFVAVFGGALAAVRAARDDAAGALDALAEAERAARSGEPRIAATVALHRLRVEATAGASARAIASQRGAAVGLERQSDDVRFASRMLDRVVPTDAPRESLSARALVVAEDATWIDLPSGKRIDLRRRAVQRRLVECLVRKRIAEPGVSVTVAELVAAGWPGEKLAESSAQNRLHVALATLRADGLRDLLLRDSTGYALDAAIDVRTGRR
jgi:predicted ATPase